MKRKKEEYLEAIKASKSIAQVCKTLGLKCAGGNYKTIKDFIRENNIDTSHFTEEYKCECCNNTEWNGKPIPLELHHINGDNTDNRIENLQILCPNCHAQTEHYRGKNINGRVMK